jgi:hypothetical protein
MQTSAQTRLGVEMRKICTFYAVSLFIMSCVQRSTANADTQAFALQPCLTAEGGSGCETVDGSLMELSGIVAHSSKENVFWVHNDQGKPRVYAINESGKILTTLNLNTMDFDDAEDISLGDGPEPGRRYIYVGDIGKSRKKVGTVKVFRFKEPLADELASSEISIPNVDLIRLRYSDDKEIDFETQLIDPISGDLYLVAKEEFKVFKAKHNDLLASSDVLNSGSLKLSEVRDNGNWDGKLSGGAVSPDGKEIILRTSSKAWLYRRSAGQTIEEALAKPALTIPLQNEFNGEAITFDKQGLDFYTVSERIKKDDNNTADPQPVFHYKRLN